MKINKQNTIVCGPVHSGKTSAVNDFLKTQSNVSGILTPDVDGLRVLKDLETGMVYPFQVNNDDMRAVTQIGKYKFLNSTFELARAILSTLALKTPETIVVDEIGKLEMQDAGFEPALGQLISKHRNSNTTLILIIRDTLLAAAIEKYHLQDAEILKADPGESTILKL